MKLQQFLSFFKSNKSDNIEYIPTLWEDDYCQIELIPQENYAFVKQQIDEANLFAEQHKTEFGYTDVFIRQEKPVSTNAKEIRADYLRNAIVSFQLSELTKLRYEGGKETFMRESKTQAFGFPSFTLFFDTEGEFVKNIWVKISLIISVKEFDIILSSLYYLGEENDLILIDWNDDDIVDLKNKTQIKDYLMDWWK